MQWGIFQELKLRKSSAQIWCLSDLLDDGDEEGGTAEEGVNLIDRGSPKHINESKFQATVIMNHLQCQNPQTLRVKSQNTF